jgi:hypothetical protein
MRMQLKDAEARAEKAAREIQEARRRCGTGTGASRVCGWEEKMKNEISFLRDWRVKTGDLTFLKLLAQGDPETHKIPPPPPNLTPARGTEGEVWSGQLHGHKAPVALACMADALTPPPRWRAPWPSSGPCSWATSGRTPCGMRERCATPHIGSDSNDKKQKNTRGGRPVVLGPQVSFMMRAKHPRLVTFLGAGEIADQRLTLTLTLTLMGSTVPQLSSTRP